MSAANEWDVKLNTKREIPYLQATMNYFAYHINTIALYWQEKPTSSMNENEWIDNPRITIVECVGANSQDEKIRCIMITKTSMVVIFNLQNSHLLTLSLLTDEVFQVDGQNLYWFSSPSRKVWTSLSVNEVQTHERLAAIIRENSDKQLVLRILRALPFIHQPGRVEPKASDMSAADWLYQYT